jgi:hypothetical protein
VKSVLQNPLAQTLLWEQSLRKPISLWDMYRYQILECFFLLNSVTREATALAEAERRLGAATELTFDETKRGTDILAAVAIEAKRLKMERTQTRVAQFGPNMIMRKDHTYQVVRGEFDGLLECMIADFKQKTFAFIPNEKAAYFECDNLFGDSLRLSFSDEINAEIKAAGNCLAAELNTAAIFHFLRAAELGMRRLAKRLKVQIIRDRKPIKIDDATWDELIINTNKKVESEKALPPPQRKIKKHFKEYERVAQQFDHMKNDRNNIMHTHGDNTPAEALAVMGRVKDFMQMLVKRIPLK